jgi:TolB-like protein
LADEAISVVEPVHSPKLVRFGTFEVDLRAGELWKSGRKRKLAGQPFLVLAMLLERPGEMVTREELQQRLWPDTFVDVEHSLNAAINKIREALNDSAESPHFVETLPRRGYRFVAPVDSGTPVESMAKISASAPALKGTANAGLRSGSEEGFWIAVLPFKSSGADPELAALAAGITEDIVTGLSRFSYLRVLSLSSTSRYTQEETDLRSVSKELGARYVLEGSVRQSGDTLRIAVQLNDASFGVDLWAEHYDRAFRSVGVFDLLDEVVPRIVSTIADTQGVLPHSMSEATRSRNPEELTPYEAVLRSFAHFQRVSAGEHAASRTALERAVEQAPGYADGWAMLSMLYKEEYTHEFNLRPDPLGRAFCAAQRAVEAAPSSHLAHHALAATLFFRREMQAFRVAAERAIALNPMDGFTMAYLGFLIAYSGDWKRGCAVSEQARSLNPHHPGWYWFAPFFDAYRKHEYGKALEIAPRIHMPGFWRTKVALGALYGQVGEREAARRSVEELLELRPKFAGTANEELAKWWEPELVEQLIDGLKKAGLEIVR